MARHNTTDSAEFSLEVEHKNKAYFYMYFIQKHVVVHRYHFLINFLRTRVMEK